MKENGAIRYGIMLSFISIAIILSAGTISAETIEGNKVYVDTSRVYFDQEPHTIDDFVENVSMNFISKQFTGNIDVGFGFPSDVLLPENAYLNNSGILIDVSSAFNKIDFEYGGMDRWYFTQDFFVNADQNYNIIVNMKRIGIGSGKYWVCAKPSAQTIQQAITGGNFLCLDPWFDISFAFRQEINATCLTCNNDAETVIPINDTLVIDGSNETFWCNIVANQSDQFVYFNNYTDYICANDTAQLPLFIDMGNGTDFNNPFGDAYVAYTINMTEGSVAYDESENVFNGALSGGTAILKDGGRIARGFYLPSEADILTVSASATASHAIASMLIWFRPDNTMNSSEGIGNNGDRLYRSVTGVGDVFFIENDGKLSFDSWCSSGTLQSTTNSWTGGDWYQIAVRWNASEVTLFINGTIEDSCPPHASVTGQQIDGLIIGDRPTPTWSGARGMYDNFMLHSGANTFSYDDIRFQYESIQLYPFERIGDIQNVSGINVTFISQIPVDITATNIMNETANITYEINGIEVNFSTIRLETEINSSLGTSSISINGISTLMNIPYNFSFNITDRFTTILGDNQIYPASYNIDDEVMEDTIHSVFTASNDNNVIKTRILNVSDNAAFSFFEIMMNSSSGVCDVFYCNSSYSTGSVTTSNNCGGFASVAPNTPYNHTHPGIGKSSHIVLPVGLDVATGTIEDVEVTPLSYFIMRGSACNTFYIANDTVTTETSVNNGVSWSSQPWTIDAHLHQFQNDETLYYRQCANDTTGNKFCSDLKSDNLDITPLPPSAPFIITPQEGTVSDTVGISYEECISPIGNVINYYNISLLDTNLTFFDTIENNNSLSLTFNWDSKLVVDNDYIIEVNCVDNQSLNTSAFSGTITILNNITIEIPVSVMFCADENNLYIREVETETTITGSLIETNTTIEERLRRCNNGCLNSTLIALGGPGCVEEPMLLWLILLVSVILGIVMFKGINK